MKYTIKTNEYGTFWYKEGTNILHNENGPAILSTNGNKEWLINGRLHRVDGPAVEHTNGFEEYWIHGRIMTDDQFHSLKKTFSDTQLENMSLEELIKTKEKSFVINSINNNYIIVNRKQFSCKDDISKYIAKEIVDFGVFADKSFKEVLDNVQCNIDDTEICIEPQKIKLIVEDNGTIDWENL
jgi:hypothetical protein